MYSNELPIVKKAQSFDTKVKVSFYLTLLCNPHPPHPVTIVMDVGRGHYVLAEAIYS